MLCLTRPDVIRAMHSAFFEVGVDAVETASFGSFSQVLTEYDIADKAYELNVAGRQPRPRGRRRFRHRRAVPLRRRLDRAGHEDAEPRAHRLRVAPRLLRGTGRRSARGRRRPLPHRDVLRPAPDEGGDRRLPAGDEGGRARGAAAGPGHDGDHRTNAARQRDRRRAGVDRGDAARCLGHQLRHRPGRDAGAPALPVAALAVPDQRAAQRRPAQHRRRAARTTTSRPTSSPRSTAITSPTSGSRRRWLLRYDARAPAPGRRSGQGHHAEAAAHPSSSPASRRSTHRSR